MEALDVITGRLLYTRRFLSLVVSRVDLDSYMFDLIFKMNFSFFVGPWALINYSCYLDEFLFAIGAFLNGSFT